MPASSDEKENAIAFQEALKKRARRHTNVERKEQKLTLVYGGFPGTIEGVTDIPLGQRDLQL